MNHRFRLFILIQNPLHRLMQHYIQETKNYNYKQHNFKQYYLNRKTKFKRRMSDNILTRSILCKMQGELTSESYNQVKSFLENKAYIGDVSNYMHLIKMNQWKSSKEAGCMKHNLKHSSRNFDSLLDEEIMKRVNWENKFDFDIYWDYMVKHRNNAGG